LSGAFNIALLDSSSNPVALSVGNNNASTTYSGVFSSTGSLTKSGTGTLTLSGANTYSGSTTVSGGTLVLSGVANANNSNIAVSNAANLGFSAASGSYSFTKAITGTAGSITFNVDGDTSATGNNDGTNFTLANTGTFTGTVVINTGLVAPSADSAFGAAANVIQLNAASGASSGLLDAPGGTFILPATRSIQLVNAGGNGIFRTYGSGRVFEIAGVISGAGNLVATDLGTLELAGTNTFTGTANGEDGTLNLANTLALQNSTLIGAAGGVVFNSSVSSHAFTLGGLSGAFNIALLDSSSNPVALSVGNNNASTTYSGVFSSNGSLTKIGTGTLMLTNTNNSYSGGTTVSGGTLQLGDGVSNNGAVAGNITDNATLAFANPAAQTYGGIVSGSGGVTVSGSGVETLSNVSSYSGMTNVTGGTLVVSGSLSATSRVNVIGGTLGGGGLIANNVVVGTGSGAPSVIKPSAGSGVVGTVLTVLNNLTLSGSDAAYQFTLNSSNANGITDKLNVGNTLAIGTGATLTGLDFGGGTVPIGTQYIIATAFNVTGFFANAPQGSLINIGSNEYTIDYTANSDQEIVLTAAVPEPATWVAMLSGLGLLVGLQRLRRKGLGNLPGGSCE